MRIKKYLSAVPIIAWMGFFVGCPLIYILFLSFMTRGTYGNIVYEFTFENYSRIFDPLYFKIFAESMGTALVVTIICLLIAYPFAYFITGMKKKMRSRALVLVMIPFWTSSLLRVYGWMIILQTKGILNQFFQFFGLEPFRMMYTFGAVLLGTVYMLLPFMILPIYNAVEKIDKSLVEASYDLGAGKFQTFLNITLPLSVSGILAGMTLVFIPAVGLFFVSDLLGGADTMLLGNLIQNQINSARNWPFASALSVILMIIVLLFVSLYIKASPKDGQGGLFL